MYVPLEGKEKEGLLKMNKEIRFNLHLYCRDMDHDANQKMLILRTNNRLQGARSARTNAYEKEGEGVKIQQFRRNVVFE